MGNAFDAFLRDQVRRGLRKNTVEGRRRRLLLFARWIGDEDRVLVATPEEIQAFLERRPLVARTRSHWLSMLHVFYRFAVREGYASADPTEMIDRPRLHRLIPRPIADDDLESAIAGATIMMRCWLLLAAYEGLRCAEIAALSREDVLDSLSEPMLRVSETGAKGGNEDLLPLHPDVLVALRLHGMPRTGPIFRRASGRPFPSWDVSHRVSVYLHDLGTDATAHQLRHWFGTQIYADTRDIRLTQELLRHASPSSTAIYTAFNRAGAPEAVRKLRAGPRVRRGSPEQDTG